jgi:hypothetical protein
MDKGNRIDRSRVFIRALIIITPCCAAWVMLFDGRSGVPGILSVITAVTALVLLLDAPFCKRVLPATVRLFLLIMISFGFAFSLYERPTILLYDWHDGTGNGGVAYKNGAIHYRRTTWAVTPGQDVPSGGPTLSDLGVGKIIFGLPQLVVRRVEEPIGTFLEIQLPAWLLFTAFGILFVLFVRPWKKLHSSLHCASCSYCIIANESGLCPECGMPIPEEQKQAISKAANSM